MPKTLSSDSLASSSGKTKVKEEGEPGAANGILGMYLSDAQELILDLQDPRRSPLKFPRGVLYLFAQHWGFLQILK